TWSEPGVLQRDLQTPWGPMTGERVAAQSAFSTIVHGWDLAAALGQRVDLPANLLDLSWGLAHELVPVLREAGVMEAPVDVRDEATPTERLLAFMGRDPSQAP
ncbi:MAG: TIGR03086 family protein, partial [Sporichthyaceae bacterium]|nr:TIGR03086 family protein [Sporichthyaceae bacterium]